MIKRTIYIGSASYVSIDTNRLKIENRETGEIKFLPLEDLGVIEFDHPQILTNNYCLGELSRNNVAVTTCGVNHHPDGLLLPLDGNTLQSKRTSLQSAAKKPLLKQLWAQIVKAKLTNQGRQRTLNICHIMDYRIRIQSTKFLRSIHSKTMKLNDLLIIQSTKFLRSIHSTCMLKDLDKQIQSTKFLRSIHSKSPMFTQPIVIQSTKFLRSIHSQIKFLNIFPCIQSTKFLRSIHS